MKKIGLISDTHGWLDEAVFNHFKTCDEIWHAGDIGSLDVLDQLRKFKPLKVVFGNIDDHVVRNDTHETLHWSCEGLEVVMTHIGGRPGQYSLPVRKMLTQNKPELFICGHSHICLAMNDPKFKLLHLNPGAAGRQGFHHVRTMMRFQIDVAKLTNLEVIELGPRSERVV